MSKARKRLFILGVLAAAALLSFWGWRRLGSLELVEARLASWPASQVVRSRDGTIIGMSLSADGEFCVPVPLSSMGKLMPRLTVLVEDKRFWRHGGVDWQGLASAAVDWAFRGRRRGGSTITTQVIRMAYPAPRTLGTKIREFAQADTLERRLKKEQILELYLNRAPFGSNIRGVEAAAQMWFGRTCQHLTAAQAALLVGMVKAPTAYRPDLNPQAAKRRRDLILSMAKDAGIIDSFQYQCALDEALPSRLLQPPSQELLFCQAVTDRLIGQDVTTTLDRSCQKIVRSALETALAHQPPEVTAAAVLLENETGAVRALVPNARWGSGNSGQWVDCSSALRSPGSSLKPFVYAMAFERGVLTPGLLMADTPLGMGGRTPRNFDKLYRGPVSAKRALNDSLNVPAVRALRAVSADELLRRMRRAGLENIKKEADWYGDSLVLGGCEVSPLQLAEACTVFARLGERISPVFEAGRTGAVEQVFTPQAAWLVTDCLSDPSRLPITLRSVDALRGKFAFKTGTSYGLRDAWTAVWNGRWTLVVWLGDPTGRPHSTLVGLSAAVPAASQIFRHLPEGWPVPRPEGLERRSVCSLSGLPPSPACATRTSDWYIPAVSPSGVCQMHRYHGGRVVTVWPKELSRYMSGRDRPGQMIVASPLDGADYLYYEQGSKLALRCEGAGQVHWFVDGQFVGTSPSGTDSVMWPMKPGKHEATVMDGTGRKRSVSFTVSSIFSEPGELQELVPEPSKP